MTAWAKEPEEVRNFYKERARSLQAEKSAVPTAKRPKLDAATKEMPRERATAPGNSDQKENMPGPGEQAWRMANERYLPMQTQNDPAPAMNTPKEKILMDFCPDGSPEEGREAFEEKLRNVGVVGRRVGHLGTPGVHSIWGTVNWFASSDKRLRVDGGESGYLEEMIRKAFPPYDKERGRQHWIAMRKGKKSKPDVPKQVSEHIGPL